tara:strand:+ start:2874 stop:5273 length:2400 start_codon:yes stop_codon:yes gene_type:complete
LADFLKYNDADVGQRGVLLKLPLTSPITTGNQSLYTTITPSGNDIAGELNHYDSSGYTPGNNWDSTGLAQNTISYTLSGMSAPNQAAFNLGGQVSFDIDSTFLIDPNTAFNDARDPANDSSGSEDHVSDSLGIDSTDRSADGLRRISSNSTVFSVDGIDTLLFQKQTGGTIKHVTSVADDGAAYEADDYDFYQTGSSPRVISSGNIRINGIEKPSVSRCYWGWWDNGDGSWTHVFKINNHMTQVLSSTKTPSSIIDGWLFGCRNNVSGTWVPVPIKNWLMSTEIPTWQRDVRLTQVAVVGDSLTRGGTYNSINGYAQDSGWWRGTLKSLSVEGYTASSLQQFTNGGVSLAGILADIGTTLATNPTTWISQMPTNDILNAGASGMDTAAQEALFKEYIETAFGVYGGGDYNGITQYFFVNQCPIVWRGAIESTDPDYQNIADAYSWYRDFKKTLPAWWDTTYPDLAGRVVVGGDSDADLGIIGNHALATDSDIYTQDGVHWDATSAYSQGKTLGTIINTAFVSGDDTMGTIGYKDLSTGETVGSTIASSTNWQTTSDSNATVYGAYTAIGNETLAEYGINGWNPNGTITRSLSVAVYEAIDAGGGSWRADAQLAGSAASIDIPGNTTTGFGTTGSPFTATAPSISLEAGKTYVIVAVFSATGSQCFAINRETEIPEGVAWNDLSDADGILNDPFVADSSDSSRKVSVWLDFTESGGTTPTLGQIMKGIGFVGQGVWGFKDLTKSSATLFDSAYWSNQYASSQMKTGDQFIIAASDNTQIFNVTVDSRAQTVTLSTGLEIL